MKTSSVVVTRVSGASRETAPDGVAVEEPLEISVAWHRDSEPREKTISVTMRTPGDDFDLAAGFLFAEGLVRSGEEIEDFRHWGSPNKVRAALAAGARVDLSKLDRHFYTASGCGVCGKTSIDALQMVSSPLPPSAPLTAELVRSLAATLDAAQSAFHETGGVHGAALIGRDGALLRVREDVGRHNAVDKVIGSFVRHDPAPMRDAILMVSSRGSFEIVQKAIVAGIPRVAFAGGPSSLAIDLARRFNVTLLGFVRGERFNLYCGEVT